MRQSRFTWENTSEMKHFQPFLKHVVQQRQTQWVALHSNHSTWVAINLIFKCPANLVRWCLVEQIKTVTTVDGQVQIKQVCLKDLKVRHPINYKILLVELLTKMLIKGDGIIEAMSIVWAEELLLTPALGPLQWLKHQQQPWLRNTSFLEPVLIQYIWLLISSSCRTGEEWIRVQVY